MRIQEAMGMGVPAGTAQAIAGSCAETFTATGTTTTDATVLTAVNTMVTTGATDTGVRLPSDAQVGDCYMVGAGSGNTIKVYPHTGGKINNGTTDAAKSVTTTKAIIVKRVGPTQWLGVVE